MNPLPFGAHFGVSDDGGNWLWSRWPQADVPLAGVQARNKSDERSPQRRSGPFSHSVQASSPWSNLAPTHTSATRVAFSTHVWAQRLCMHVIGVSKKERTGRWSRLVMLGLKHVRLERRGGGFISAFRAPRLSPPHPIRCCYLAKANRQCRTCLTVRLRDAGRRPKRQCRCHGGWPMSRPGRRQHWNTHGGGEATAPNPTIEVFAQCF